MLRLLAGGTTLVLDRYSYSGVAYTAAKGVPHLGPDFCRSVEVGQGTGGWGTGLGAT